MKAKRSGSQSFTKIDESLSQSKALDGGFKQGFLVGISNPKDIIFFAAFFRQFIQITPHLNISLGVLTLDWIVLDFATFMNLRKIKSPLSRDFLFFNLKDYVLSDTAQFLQW